MKKGLIENITERLREKNKPSQRKQNDVFQVSSVEDYVNKIINLKIPAHEKRKLGAIFKRSTNTTTKDLEYIRNRHPYYKKLKNKGHTQRQSARNAKTKNRPGSGARWEASELMEFLSLTDKLTDLQLADYFNRSIPAINAVRRRIRRVRDAGREADIKTLILKDERTLRRVLTLAPRLVLTQKRKKK